MLGDETNWMMIDFLRGQYPLLSYCFCLEGVSDNTQENNHSVYMGPQWVLYNATVVFTGVYMGSP